MSGRESPRPSFRSCRKGCWVIKEAPSRNLLCQELLAERGFMERAIRSSTRARDQLPPAIGLRSMNHPPWPPWGN
jgi:hypothetical protein